MAKGSLLRHPPKCEVRFRLKTHLFNLSSSMAEGRLPSLGGHLPMCQMFNVDPWVVLNNFCLHVKAQNSFNNFSHI